MARLLRLFFVLLVRSLRSRHHLLLENLALRQQVLVLARHRPPNAIVWPRNCISECVSAKGVENECAWIVAPRLSTRSRQFQCVMMMVPCIVPESQACWLGTSEEMETSFKLFVFDPGAARATDPESR